VTVWSEDPRLAEDRLRSSRKAIQGRDFPACADGHASRHGSAACLAMSTQCPPATGVALNLAHMMPSRRFGQGRTGEHFQHRRCSSRGRKDRGRSVGLHVGDFGHTLIGPTARAERAAGADGAAVPPLRRGPVFALTLVGSIRAAALADGAIGTISAAPLQMTSPEPVACSRFPSR